MGNAASLQLEFAALGIGEMPQGVGDLTTREIKFVRGVLEHGQMAHAAVEAGYSPDSAGSIASETLRKPKVQAFYRRCLDKVASQAELVVRRIYERSVIFHAKAMEAAQTRQDADAWILSYERHERSRGGKEVKEFELKRDRAMREEKHYAQLARAEDALLLNALGRLKVSPGAEPLNLVSEDVRHHLGELARAGIDLSLPMAVGGN